MHHHPDCHHPSSHKVRLLWTALMLIGGFALIECAAGFASHSLALIAESGHMLSDCLALGIALLATWIAALPASPQATFGYRRVEILAALVNGVGLLAIALWISWEAIARLQSPAPEILGIPMLITAAVGLGVNSLNAFLLHDHSHQDLNLRGAFLHMVADAVSSVGVLLAAIAIWVLHWDWADGATSLLVAVLIVVGAIPLIRQSLTILMEQPPSHLNVDDLQTCLGSFDGVKTVERLQVWAIALGQETLIAHLTVTIADGQERDRLLQHMQKTVQQDFGIQDVILQITSPLPPELVNLSHPPSLTLIGRDSDTVDCYGRSPAPQK